MERMVEKIAKTIDEAINEALKELKENKENVDIEIIFVE